MRPFFLFLLITFVAAHNIEAQCHGFVQNTTGDTAAISNSSVIDGNDNVYTIGVFQGSLTIGTATLKTTTLPTGIFLTKIDKNGEFVYAKLIAETISSDVQSPNIAVGTSEIMIEGVVHDSLLVSGNLSHQQGADHIFFVMKLGLDGSITWNKSYFYRDILKTGAYGNIVSDRKGGAFVATNFRDTLTIGTKQFSGSGLPVLILHFDGSGNVLWTKESGLAGGYAKKMALDGNGNVILAGLVNGGIQFDDKSTGSSALNNIPRVFVVSISNDGTVTNWLWSQQQNSGATTTNPWPVLGGLVCDRSNNIYFSGEIGDSVQFDNTKLVGRFSMYIAKLNSSGTLVWAQMKSGHASSRPEVGYAMGLDSNQNLFIAGSFVDSTYLGTQKFTGYSGGAWFTANFIDSAHWDHINISQNNNDAYPQNILTTSKNNIVVTVTFLGNSTSYAGLTATNGNDQNPNAYNLAWFGSCALGSSVEEPLPYSDGITIYPDPVGDELNVKFKNDYSGIATYRIVNGLGIEVSKNSINATDGTARIPFFKDIPPGMYFLILQTGGEVLSEKFLKE